MAQGAPLIIPNAGNVAATRDLCAPSIFRTSFTNWQPAYGMGRALAAQGIKRAAWVGWDYAAGKEAGEGFADGLRAGGAELVAQEEVFGPVLSVIPFDTEGEAIGIANATRYGLAAGIWTESLPRAMRVSRAIRAGTVWVNTYRAVAVQARLAGSRKAGSAASGAMWR